MFIICWALKHAHSHLKQAVLACFLISLGLPADWVPLNNVKSEQQDICVCSRFFNWNRVFKAVWNPSFWFIWITATHTDLISGNLNIHCRTATNMTENKKKHRSPTVIKQLRLKQYQGLTIQSVCGIYSKNQYCWSDHSSMSQFVSWLVYFKHIALKMKCTEDWRNAYDNCFLIFLSTDNEWLWLFEASGQRHFW